MAPSIWWNSQKDEQLIKLYEKRWLIKQISHEMGKTYGSIRLRINYLGIRRDKPVLTRRFDLNLTEAQYVALQAEARKRNILVPPLVRSIVDSWLHDEIYDKD
jgi:hypothetical protein